MLKDSIIRKFQKIRRSQQGLLETDTDYLYCAVCKIHVACRRIPSGGWEVQCPGCAGECAFCECHLKQYCFGNREQFPPFDSPTKGSK